MLRGALSLRFRENLRRRRLYNRQARRRPLHRDAQRQEHTYRPQGLCDQRHTDRHYCRWLRSGQRKRHLRKRMVHQAAGTPADNRFHQSVEISHHQRRRNARCKQRHDGSRGYLDRHARPVLLLQKISVLSYILIYNNLL